MTDFSIFESSLISYFVRVSLAMRFHQLFLPAFIFAVFLPGSLCQTSLNKDAEYIPHELLDPDMPCYKELTAKPLDEEALCNCQLSTSGGRRCIIYGIDGINPKIPCYIELTAKPFDEEKFCKCKERIFELKGGKCREYEDS